MDIGVFLDWANLMAMDTDIEVVNDPSNKVVKLTGFQYLIGGDRHVSYNLIENGSDPLRLVQIHLDQEEAASWNREHVDAFISLLEEKCSGTSVSFLDQPRLQRIKVQSHKDYYVAYWLTKHKDTENLIQYYIDIAEGRKI